LPKKPPDVSPCGVSPSAGARPAPLLVFTAWQLVVGGLLLLLLTLLIEGPPPTLHAGNIAGFVYLGLINTGLAYTLWFRGIERLSATRVTFLALLSPVVAVAAGFVVLGQRLSATQLVGVLVVLISIIVAQRIGQHKAVAQLPATVARATLPLAPNGHNPTLPAGLVSNSDPSRM